MQLLCLTTCIPGQSCQAGSKGLLCHGVLGCFSLLVPLWLFLAHAGVLLPGSRRLHSGLCRGPVQLGCSCPTHCTVSMQVL